MAVYKDDGDEMLRSEWILQNRNMIAENMISTENLFQNPPGKMFKMCYFRVCSLDWLISIVVQSLTVSWNLDTVN